MCMERIAIKLLCIHKMTTCRLKSTGKLLVLFNCSHFMNTYIYENIFQQLVMLIDILYTLDSASLLVKLKPRIFQRSPPFE